MKVEKIFIVRPFLRFSTHKFTRYLAISIILIILIFFLPLGCVERRMSLKEAKQVALSMEERSFVPPPRRIDDITTILDQQAPDPEAVKRLIAKANATPPEGANEEGMLKFYYERGMSAKKLGRLRQSLMDFRTAARFIPQYPSKTPTVTNMFIELALAEISLNNFRDGIESIERAQKNFPTWVGGDKFFVKLYTSFGDLEAAEKAKNRAMNMMSGWRSDSASVWKRHNTAKMKAAILEARGQYKEAEPFHRQTLRTSVNPVIKSRNPRNPITARHDLARNLMHQGRLVEAEVDARQSLLESLSLSGKKSLSTLRMVGILARILSKQGRHQDAERLLRESVHMMEEAGVSPESMSMGGTRFTLGVSLLKQGDWEGALAQFRMAERGLRKDPVTVKKFLLRKTALPMALLRTGHAGEALELLHKAYEIAKKDFGADHHRTMKILGLLAVALSDTGKTSEAFDHYSRAVPSLLERSTGGAQQGKLILERYIALLSRIRGTALEREAGIDASAEAFRIADAARARSVQSALAQSATRTAMHNPELADSARREQDAEKQISALEALLSEHLAAPVDQQSPKVVADLREMITNLRKAQQVLREEIEERFSRYSELLNPPPTTVDKVQEQLRPGEVLIAIYPAVEETYVWAVPQRGKVQFAAIPLGKRDLKKTVAHLRKALDPKPETFGGIPEFDLALAYDLYSRLIKPVEEGWRDAKDLIVVAPGSLGQLPFSVLTTSPVELGMEKKELFANYRKVPWLIRKVSITRQPSVSSFVTLRTTPEGDPDRKAFAGFGDPIFNLAQLAGGESESGRPIVRIASRGGRVHVRGIRVTKEGNLDSKKISSAKLGNLNRLPDTAEEIKGIANALGADPTQDIFLEKDASERQVKTMDLSNRRVITFATHALVPGDLDGLDEPAIALSAPAVTGDNEDGLLTMGEILRLKLNADWVVLSACNTGAADGAGAEAVSGLGRAFFYAGTRALLVSMWPVESSSAKNLTTGLFRYQKEDKTLSRARAHQRSMIELIDNQVLKDEATGKIIASYAHPLFWAPFIVVGDGG